MRSVVLVVLDGVRPDAIAAARASALQRLMEEGASTMTARTVMPCISLPCHTSMFCGVEPGRHGITSNVWHPMARPVPSIVDVVYEAGRKTGMFYNWEPLRDLAAPYAVDESHMIRYDAAAGAADDSDRRLFGMAADWMRGMPGFGFAFVYFGAADNLGHAHGWMSEPYLRSVREADELIETVLLPALPGECLLVVTADHGGHDRTHGDDRAEDMTIPVILRGEGIEAGSQIEGAVSIMDLAPTMAKWLRIDPPPEWIGRALI